MKISRLVRSILQTAIYVMDQTADRVERASDRASKMAEDAREALHPSERHLLRNLISFAAGVGCGIGAGVLLAPSSGKELRGSISGKVHDIGNAVRGRREAVATGTGA